MVETREELLARLEQLSAAETELVQQAKPKPTRFKTVTFGGISEEIEVRPFVQRGTTLPMIQPRS